MSDPKLESGKKTELVSALMEARRAVGQAKLAGDTDAEKAARTEVDRTKRALGERGPVWWGDGAPDYNRRLARNTPYAEWFVGLR